MKFKEAAKIYWRVNPLFQVLVVFLAAFIGGVLWAGNVPAAIWIILGATISTLSIGVYVNIRGIKKRHERQEQLLSRTDTSEKDS